jgi:hypothetical protein
MASVGIHAGLLALARTADWEVFGSDKRQGYIH